jgi:hypothetical protein
LYRDDWGRPKNISTIVSATAFSFVVQLIPALIFADLLERETEGRLAFAETLLSGGIIGIVYAIFSGQPLTLLGITGPVAILLGTSYSLAKTFESDYWPFFWWLCVWTAIMHWITAVMGVVEFVWKITPFTTQIFEFFIAISFIYESIRDLVEPLHLQDTTTVEGRGAAYGALVIGMMTFCISWTLHFAETWVYFTRQVRTALVAYNMAIAVIVATALSYLPGINQTEGGHGLERVNVKAPWNWRPTDQTRGWLTDPFFGIGPKGIFGALFPAFMLYLLFFIDHNISSILTQSPKYNLKKPSAYHWDFFVLGLTIVPCGILGLPPGSGLIPQAPLHTRALATKKYLQVDGVIKEMCTHVEEQRWSAFSQAALMFVALSSFEIISWIPKAALFGVFLYLGVSAMHGNDVWRNVSFMFMVPKKRPRIKLLQNVGWRTIQCFTAIQVASAVLIFGIAQFADWGYVFPALVCACVPLRERVVSYFFTVEDLKYLDPFGETEDEYDAERREVYDAERRADVDPVEYTVLPGRHDFHTADIRLMPNVVDDHELSPSNSDEDM